MQQVGGRRRRMALTPGDTASRRSRETREISAYPARRGPAYPARNTTAEDRFRSHSELIAATDLSVHILLR